MRRGGQMRRNFSGWIVLVASISTLTQLISLALQRRRRFRALHLGDGQLESCGQGRPRLHHSWTKLLKEMQLCFAIFSHTMNWAPPRCIIGQWYIKPRTTEWYYLFTDWTPESDPIRFKQFFRISPEMFAAVCDLVRQDLETDPPYALTTLPNRVFVVERQVAVAIRRLATGDSLLGIAELFGISKASASKAIWRFIQSFTVRAAHFLTWPQGRALEEVKAGFNERWGFPNCCGAIDCTHFIIETPPGENKTHYYDWKHNLSITMQAVVDVNGKFLDVLIGMPGSTQDSRLLRLSQFFLDVVYEGTKLNGPVHITGHGLRIGEYILGDGGYPLYRWLIVPYPRNQSFNTDRFNNFHSSARMCVERAFGKLKGVWRILSRQIQRPRLERLSRMVHCCVLLQNMIHERGDDIPAVVWGDMAAHPDGYGPYQRPNRAFFQGGPQTRDALVVEVQTARGFI